MNWHALGDIDKFAPEWVAALGEMSDVVKSEEAKGAKFSYKYADLAAVAAVVRPTLAKHGLAVFQSVTREDAGVVVETTVMHTSGQGIVFKGLAMAAGYAPQEAGSSITYARRYALLAACGMATEDDDGAKAGEADPSQVPPMPHSPTTRTQATTPKPDAVPEGFVSRTAAKNAILKATGGDVDAAAAIWKLDGTGDDPMKKDALDALLSRVEAEFS